MALGKPNPGETNPGPTREALWQKRLRREAQRMRACREDDGPQPYRETVRVRVTRMALRLAGLYDQGVRNANSPVLHEVTFSFHTLPAAFDGFRILHLSDFHFNNRPGFTQMMCGLVRDLEADLAVFTGDYRFNPQSPCSSVYEGMTALVENLRAPCGALAVLGNNDMNDFVERFGALGIRVLVNEALEVARAGDRIWFAGVDDPHEFRCDGLRPALDEIPEGAFTVLLPHSPEPVREAAAAGVDLYLCGHTHGGQVCLPWMGPLYTNCRCARAHVAGPWRYGDLQGYTNRGLGTSTIPIRFNCPPEAALITLRRAPLPHGP